jgi:hypothetical protein
VLNVYWLGRNVCTVKVLKNKFQCAHGSVCVRKEIVSLERLEYQNRCVEIKYSLIIKKMLLSMKICFHISLSSFCLLYQDTECQQIIAHFYYFLFFIAVVAYIVALLKVLTIYQIYNTWIHHPHPHSPLSPYPHSWNSFNRSQFSIYTHMNRVFVPYSPPIPFLHILPHPQEPNLPERPFCALLFCNIVKEKWLFYLFKIALQWVSLWHFDVHVPCNLIFNNNIYCPLRFSRNLRMQFWKCHVWVWNRIEHFIIHM